MANLLRERVGATDPTRRVQNERDRAQQSVADTANAIDVLAALAAAVPDWLPDGAELRLGRPRNARAFRAALYDGRMCVASAYGARPSDALIKLRAEIVK